MLFFISPIRKYLRHEAAKEIGMVIFLVTRSPDKLKSLKVLFLQKYLHDLIAKIFVVQIICLKIRPVLKASVHF